MTSARHIQLFGQAEQFCWPQSEHPLDLRLGRAYRRDATEVWPPRVKRRSVMKRIAWRTAVAVMSFLLLPAAAYAQAAITGVVRDTSGAVLPGVTVEAASPVLIEKVRSVVSDDTGQYRIVDLRPGAYAVTFTLPGFSAVKREGIELSGTFVASVDAELRVGAVEETITVTGESPIVDVQSARTQQIIDREI